MIILDADRFGLATLHQLRGRVGRGSLAAQVYLVTASKKHSLARRRLDILENTFDGFELSQKDLELRREGDILGYRQSGTLTLHVCDMVRDMDLIEAAHRDVGELLDGYSISPISTPSPTITLICCRFLLLPDVSSHRAVTVSGK